MGIRQSSSDDDLKRSMSTWFTKRKMIVLGIVGLVIILALAIGLGVGLSRRSSSEESGASTGNNGTVSGNGTFWQPKSGMTWQIDLIDNYTATSTLADVQVYDIDLFNNPVGAMQHIKSSGIKLICYFSAGSFEDWRVDASSFPSSALGKPLQGWQGERWVNTNSKAIRDIMVRRMKLAKEKGCDAVDPDNVDAYDNDNGLGLTHADAVSYVTFLAQQAHNLNMSVSLKNAGAIINQTVSQVDFSVNEECVQYQECSNFETFIQEDKPVFHIEYPADAKDLTAAQVCQRTPKGFSTVIKNKNLDNWYETCNGTTLVVPSVM
jgi:endo-alpha-1,4-polygalactosaminidase (GH114 family)